MKVLVSLISKWAHEAPSFARLTFCGCSKSGGTRVKNDGKIGICMDNSQKNVKKANKISGLTPIFLKSLTKQVYRNTNVCYGFLVFSKF